MKTCLDCNKSIPEGPSKRCNNCSYIDRTLYNRQWRKDNPDKIREYNRAYRRRKRNENNVPGL